MALIPAQALATGTTTARLYVRALREVRGSYMALLLSALLGLIRTPLTLVAPLPLRIIVDNVIGKNGLPPFLSWVPGLDKVDSSAVLLSAVAMFIVVAFASFVHAAVEWGFRQFVGYRITSRFRIRLFRHISQLSLAQHERDGLGPAIYAIEQNGSALQTVIAEDLILLITAAGTFIGMMAVLATLSVEICLIAMVASPLLVAGTYRFDRHLRAKWQNSHGSERAALSLVREVLGALRLVKFFGTEGREQTRLDSFIRNSEAKQRDALLSELIMKSLIGFVLALVSGTILFISARDVLLSRMTLGDLTLITAYTSMLYGPLHLIGTQLLRQQQALARLEEAFLILDKPEAIVEATNPVAVARLTGAVSFRGVRFHYHPGYPRLISTSRLEVGLQSSVEAAVAKRPWSACCFACMT